MGAFQRLRACCRPNTEGFLMMDIRGLSYVVVGHQNPQEWRGFGGQVLGMEVAPGLQGDLWLRMDERAYRVRVEKHPENRYLASAWELGNEAAFLNALQDLERAGVPFRRATEEERLRRCVIDAAFFDDPSGNHHELVLGFRTDFRRMISPTGTSFVTDPLGMGHAVLPCANFDASWTFFREVMGFQLSDLMNFKADPQAPSARIYFLHCNNARHHSLAIAEMPSPSGCIHLMVEVPDMDEVGRAMDRRAAQGAKLMASLGRHVNDRMTSFYLLCPSNFAIEYGYGGRVVDWNTNVVHETLVASLWGHDFSLGFS
jgi:3,4-dihydroxy-9,10-secoandrosta-1,3,5(10)-triene-9,17-dione 4,5-dioxygenase